MSDATLSDPQVRAAQNKWYLYHSSDTAVYGPDGFVRAIIEEASGEVVEGDVGLKHTRRSVFVSAVELRDTNPDERDKLEEALEAMSDEEFQTLIDKRTVIPISTPE